MDIPSPVPGLVIRYAYLWSSEHDAGQEEGVKDRPAGTVVARLMRDGTPEVLVLPVTHSPPQHPSDAIEIPPATKRRLGLDSERSRIVATEVNIFSWLGPDIRPVPGKAPPSVVYGLLPANFFDAVRTRLLERNAAGGVRHIRRTE